MATIHRLPHDPSSTAAAGLPLGAALGIIVGLLTGGGAGIALGLVFGAALGLIAGGVLEARHQPPGSPGR